MSKRFLYISFGALAFSFIGFVISTLYLKSVITDRRIPSVEEGEVLNIKISEPQEGGTFNLPISIKGEARVFENVVSLKVLDEENNLLLQDFFMANSPDVGEFGNFSYVIDTLLKEPVSDKIIIQVYWDSPRDGSPLDVVSIPVFLGDKNIKLAAYFGNSLLGSSDDCQKVFPLYRLTAKTEAIGAKSLSLLFNVFLSEEEKTAGYFSSLPEDAKLISLNIKDGAAYADFNSSFNSVGGSCRVSAIRSQIENTLKQFSSVKKVVISANGDVESALQP
ncbi:MAG: Gmad2 immunoglobulin-like domain-containing protein [Candidatus Pacebacteria bacterium]|nr:Gmad2 immunoglobulin-like domain-containing protein [Candidatus Paceibacterota bacterium]